MMEICPTVPLTITCDFDVTYFPFDSHLCTIHMESLRFNESLQRFHSQGFMYSSYDWRGNDQWDLLPISMLSKLIIYQEGRVNFSAIEAIISLQRKANYYIIAMLVPFSSVSLMEFATFFLPLETSDRLNLSFTCLLAFSFFSSIMNSDLPHSSEHLPILFVVVNCYMAVIGIVIILQAFIIFVHNNEQENWAKRTILPGILGNSPPKAAYRLNFFAASFFIITTILGFGLTFIYVPIVGRQYK